MRVHRTGARRPAVAWVAALAVAAAALTGTAARTAWAGPPFLTDDPEPIELHSWELYLASQWDIGQDAQAGTLPHVEVNYGAVPEVQLHLLIPAAFARVDGQSEYGPGDIELGAKVRLVKEGRLRPQIGTFPLVDVPTGSESRGLGSGHWSVFVPLWLQKSVGDWLTYGGPGLRIVGDTTDVEAGWLVQHPVGGQVALGVEVYVTIPTDGSAVRTQLNAGAVIDVDQHQHLLLSAGPSFGDDSFMQAYGAYLVTL